jgi:hypothetical protein
MPMGCAEYNTNYLTLTIFLQQQKDKKEFP